MNRLLDWIFAPMGDWHWLWEALWFALYVVTGAVFGVALWLVLT